MRGTYLIVSNKSLVMELNIFFLELEKGFESRTLRCNCLENEIRSY